MIGDHWEGVLRWHWTKINNGVLEAINSLVQASKRRARGYRKLPQQEEPDRDGLPHRRPT